MHLIPGTSSVSAAVSSWHTGKGTGSCLNADKQKETAAPSRKDQELKCGFHKSAASNTKALFLLPLVSLSSADREFHTVSLTQATGDSEASSQVLKS